MLKTLTTLWKKWRASPGSGQQIDALLAHADPAAPLAQRNQWLIEVAHWLHRGGSLAAADVGNLNLGGDSGTVKFPPHARLRYLLQLLERNPVWKARCALTLRRILADSDTISLLCESGMPVHSGFIGALLERIQLNLIPPAPNSTDITALFTLMFTSADDALWVAALPAGALEQISELFNHGIASDEKYAVGRLSRDLLTSIHTLVYQIGATGLSGAVRTRLPGKGPEDAPFIQLGRAIEAVTVAHSAWAEAQLQTALAAPPPATAEAGQTSSALHAMQQVEINLLKQRLLQQVNFLRVLLDQCRLATRTLYAHLEENGVSVEIVFQIERMRTRIMRVEHLLEAWLSDHEMESRARLIAELITSNRASQSVMVLMRNSFGMLARKVVERSAETGAHYIAHDRTEYYSMLKMAAGGGLVTAFTVYIKFGVTGAHLQPMVEGFLAGLNYALSFLLMHFLHFTLATKQPAMTAPTIAHKLDAVDSAAGLDLFVTSVIALVRTQAAAIFGNLILVFPVCLLAQLGFAAMFHGNLISPAKAHHTLESFSLLGPTPFYAAFTGVLLWSSSLLSGWADNWFALHRIGDVLTYNRRLRLVFGEAGATRIAAFWQRNISGIVGNASLGMMLGLVPAILTAFAVPFEVRHVTLSTGAIATSIGVLGPKVLETPVFWWAVAGTVSMAFLNVLVSFALAFQMALRSRQLPKTDRRALNRAIWQRIGSNPLCLLFPLKNQGAPAQADG
jgi:site-specific recombinase